MKGFLASLLAACAFA
jgi:hypothetical protein